MKYFERKIEFEITGIVFDQLNYLKDKEMGFTDSPVVRFELNSEEIDKENGMLYKFGSWVLYKGYTD